MQVVAAQHVLLGLRGGEHDHRDAAQIGVALHFGQHLSAVQPGKVEIEQHEVRPRRLAVLRLTPQHGQGLGAVLRHRQVVADMSLAQRLARQPHVAGVVLHQQDLDRPPVHVCVSIAGRVKRKVLPWPSADSTQMRPPWRSTIFLHTARPMPVPGYSSRLCSRLKIWNRFLMYCGSMPMPLSRTPKRHSRPSRAAETFTAGFRSGGWNFIPLAMRLSSNCRICTGSAQTVGSASWVTVAPQSSMRISRSFSVSLSASSKSTGTSGLAPLATREKLSRSL